MMESGDENYQELVEINQSIAELRDYVLDMFSMCPPIVCDWLLGWVRLFFVYNHVFHVGQGKGRNFFGTFRNKGWLETILGKEPVSIVNYTRPVCIHSLFATMNFQNIFWYSWGLSRNWQCQAKWITYLNHFYYVRWFK